MKLSKGFHWVYIYDSLTLQIDSLAFTASSKQKDGYTSAKFKYTGLKLGVVVAADMLSTFPEHLQIDFVVVIQNFGSQGSRTCVVLQ